MAMSAYYDSVIIRRLTHGFNIHELIASRLSAPPRVGYIVVNVICMKLSSFDKIIRDTDKDIMCCKFTEDMNDLVAGFTDGVIRLFNSRTGECTHSLVDEECRAYPGPVTTVKHRPVSSAHPITNTILASYVNGCIKCWKYKYDQCLYTIREKRQTLGLNYHPRYSKFITYGDDARLNMYDEEAQTQERAFYSRHAIEMQTTSGGLYYYTSILSQPKLRQAGHATDVRRVSTRAGSVGTPRGWQWRTTDYFIFLHLRNRWQSQRKNIMDGHTSRIFGCAFNPKSHHELISGGWDDVVVCWDDRQPYATRHITGVHICGEGLDFDKPGKQILTCSWQDKDSIQLWDYGSCKLIETIVPDNYQSKLYCGKLVPATNLMVCGGSDSNILRVVDVNLKITECSIRNNPGGIYGFDFGTVRRKQQKVSSTYKRASEIQSVPRVAFVTGKRLQTVDFG